MFLFICLGVSFVETTANTEKNREIIYIDPGHGGIDGGCIGVDETLEKDINLAISLHLRDCLVNLGYQVEMTRVGDYDLASQKSKNRKREDILKRCELMNDGLLYVSIHCNSFPGKAQGAQVFYNSEEGEQLALEIQESIKNFFDNTKRDASRIDDKYILDNIKSPGCIVEVGFLSNSEELKLLKTDEYQKEMAYAIAIGIIKYLS